MWQIISTEKIVKRFAKYNHTNEKINQGYGGCIIQLVLYALETVPNEVPFSVE